jgi:hypothetical protein
LFAQDQKLMSDRSGREFNAGGLTPQLLSSHWTPEKERRWRGRRRASRRGRKGESLSLVSCLTSASLSHSRKLCVSV